MKLFPCLTIATLCAAFAGCTATTQTISFVPETDAQEDVSVSIDGTPVGVVPVSYEVSRTKDPATYSVVFSKDGYVPEEMVLESYPDVDGLCSFIDSFPIPELLPVGAEGLAPVVAEPAPVEDVAPAEEPAVVADEPVPAVEPEVVVSDEPVVAVPVPVVAEDDESEVVEDPEIVDDEALVFDEEPEIVDEEPAPAPAEEPEPEVADDDVGEEPVPVPADEEEPVVDEEPAPAPAEEPEPEVADDDVGEEPAPVPADEEEPVVDEEPELDRTRTLKDIESELKSLSAQRENGSLSEAEFQKALADLKEEVQTRYAK